jgi:hypothetical protein
MQNYGLCPAAISSPADRCEETTRGVLGEEIEIILVPTIYDATLQPKGSELFDKFGYNSLRVYHEGGGKEYLDSYARTAISDIKALRCTSEIVLDRTLFIFGHAVYSNAIALHLAQLLQLSEQEQSLALDTPLGETDGFLVSDDGIVHLLTPPCE